MDREISAALLKLRMKHPFLATLSMYMRYQFTSSVDAIETDGRAAWINPNYYQRLGAASRLSSLAHITLHSALLHPLRCGPRNFDLWTIAADIVVNGILQDSGVEAPPGTAVEPRYKDLSVEQVYRKLEQDGKQLASSCRTQSGGGGEHGKDQQEQQSGQQATSLLNDDGQESPARIMQKLYPALDDMRQRRESTDKQRSSPDSKQQRSGIENYWKAALIKARTIIEMQERSMGAIPAGLLREIESVVNPKLDWRTVLWRFMARTPGDFQGFDRRFMHRGLYLDQLESESLNIYIALDTSGSISDEELGQFTAEVEAIARCYGHLKVWLYFVDSEVYGPYALNRVPNLKAAYGGGGTDFDVFFRTLEEDRDRISAALCVYMTDGLGTFPDKKPDLPVLWVVCEDDWLTEFPFGEVAYLT